VKFLLVFLVVLVIAWRWRTWREASQLAVKPKSPVVPDATTMVVCHHCGVHVPANDAVVGAQGSYCSAAHRLSMEP
jgi:uncharacterized protein